MSDENYKKCPFCAEEIKADAIKCKHCKTNLNEPATTPQNEQKQISSFVEVADKLTKKVKKSKEGLFLQTMNCGRAIIFIIIIFIICVVILSK